MFVAGGSRSRGEKSRSSRKPRSTEEKPAGERVGSGERHSGGAMFSRCGDPRRIARNFRVLVDLEAEEAHKKPAVEEVGSGREQRILEEGSVEKRGF
jgi:hypothetical protein